MRRVSRRVILFRMMCWWIFLGLRYFASSMHHLLCPLRCLPIRQARAALQSELALQFQHDLWHITERSMIYLEQEVLGALQIERGTCLLESTVVIVWGREDLWRGNNTAQQQQKMNKRLIGTRFSNRASLPWFSWL